MSNTMTTLPGQETVLACWDALAQLSPGASVSRSGAVAAAVFPSWAPLNNAIVLKGNGSVVAAAASRLTNVYAGAGVGAWALWIPARTTDLDAPDRVPEVSGLKRDTTTLVMHTTLSEQFRLHDDVVEASFASVKRFADDETVPATEVGEPERTPGLSGWVIVRDGLVVTAAWSFRHEDDCGIYAVGTVPEWRRRGLARTLVEHVLADAGRKGSRTATLQSTRMGQPLYESLGFVAAGRYEEWVPQ
jgi:GNAT superfamily N-acetyltransferase